jgi:hypothetical protein
MTPSIRPACMLALSFIMATLTGHVAVAADVTNMGFPRLAAVAIGAKDYDREEYREELARADVVVLNFYKNWRRNGMVPRDVLQDLKRRNPDVLVGTYTNINEKGDKEINNDIISKIESEEGPNGPGSDWWARDSSGDRVSTWPGNYDINITEFVKPDANGDRFPEYAAKRYYNLFYKDTPEFDFVFLDVARHAPKSSPDWNGDGRNDSRDNEQVRTWWRQGVINYIEEFRRLDPSLKFIGNVTIWRRQEIPQYQNIFDGGVLERLIGAHYSYEGSDAEGNTNSWGSWTLMMEVYRNTKAHMRQPAVMLFTMAGHINDYGLMRYGLTSCLLDDGFFSFIDVEKSHSSNPWFDEYGIDLGAAVDDPPTTPWQKGVYRREFENGVVLVNPRKNGAQTVELEPGFARFIGTQDPAHNNGQPVTRITLADRDGIVLVRQGDRPAKPAAPQDLHIIQD